MQSKYLRLAYTRMRTLYAPLSHSQTHSNTCVYCFHTILFDISLAFGHSSFKDTFEDGTKLSWAAVKRCFGPSQNISNFTFSVVMWTTYRTVPYTCGVYCKMHIELLCSFCIDFDRYSPSCRMSIHPPSAHIAYCTQQFRTFAISYPNIRDARENNAGPQTDFMHLLSTKWNTAYCRIGWRFAVEAPHIFKISPCIRENRLCDRNDRF